MTNKNDSNIEPTHLYEDFDSVDEEMPVGAGHPGKAGVLNSGAEVNDDAPVADEGPAFRPFHGDVEDTLPPAEEPIHRDEEAASRRAEMLRTMRAKLRSKIEHGPETDESGGLFAVVGKRFLGLLN